MYVLIRAVTLKHLVRLSIHGPLILQVNLPIVDIINSKYNRFVMGVKMKVRVYLKHNDSPVGCWISSKNKVSQVLRVRLYWLMVT